MCSGFGILLQTHLLRASWQVEKPSICLPLVWVHIKGFKRSEVLSLLYPNLLFCSAFCFLTSSKAKHVTGEVGPKYNEEHLTFLGSFPLLGGTLWRVCSKGRELFRWLSPPLTHCVVKSCGSSGEGGWRLWCANLTPSGKFYSVANLRSSNWLRKNPNVFLNIRLKSMVTAFIFGLGQIEIETINESVSFRKNESWQLRTGFAFGGGGGRTTKGWSSLFSEGWGDYRGVKPVPVCFLSKNPEFSSARGLESEVLLREPSERGEPPTFSRWNP